MAKNNIGKLFFEDYYKGVDFAQLIFGDRESGVNIRKQNGNITSSELVQMGLDRSLAADRFRVKVMYPGLVTGTGIIHDSKGIAGGYNLGLHFDYTTGMPIVFGSSVKGVLAAYFTHFYTGGNAEGLKKAIFEGISDGGLLPVSKRDIFFGAVITEGVKGRILADDAITPHTGGPLKNPTPITMLKIAPGCIMEFRFRLHDTGGFTKEKKLELFKTIITTVGVGAKTNVGYGQLKCVD